MKSYLKIKIKSLATEAAIIRLEERRVKARRRRLADRQGDEAKVGALSAELTGLHDHRTKDVRGEARAAQVAYGFIRGRAYRAIEQAGSSKPPLGRVADLVTKYGAVGRGEAPDVVKAWIAA